MNDDLKNAIYDILVEETGASETVREQFLRRWSETGEQETRIGGLLGKGGKVRRIEEYRIRQPFTAPLEFDPSYGVYVDYYPEDKTPEREAIIKKTNARLAELMEGQK